MPNRTAITTAALVRDTFREALARKIFWGFFGSSTMIVLFFLFIMKIDVVEGALATYSLFGREHHESVNELMRQVHGGLAAFLYTAGMLLAVLASAGLIPSIFEPGRIELLLSKPVSRYHILLGRYLGNLLVVAFNVFYLILSVWIILGIKTGIWMSAFLISGLLTVFIFSVLLTVVVLIGVVWESAAVATIVTFALMILSVILAQKNTLERLLSSEWQRNVVRFFYYAFPKIVDVGGIGRKLILGTAVESWMPVWSTALFGIVLLSASLLIFSKRDY